MVYEQSICYSNLDVGIVWGTACRTCYPQLSWWLVSCLHCTHTYAELSDCLASYYILYCTTPFSICDLYGIRNTLAVLHIWFESCNATQQLVRTWYTKPAYSTATNTYNLPPEHATIKPHHYMTIVAQIYMH